MPKVRTRNIIFAIFAIILSLPHLPAQTNTFVQRAGTKLALNGESFRYSGPNIEWLGLEGYGPHDPMGPRLPSHFEIDDAFDTAAEMGALVVRAQTIGDTVGCPLCIEPSEGHFNEAAFASSDYALAVARKHGMKLIIPLVGDCATCAGGGIGQYLAWEKKPNPQDFFTEPALIAAYERHIDAVLNHLNPITGLRYKDDPTIMAWENCNMCGILTMLSGGGPNALVQVSTWVETIGTHIKQQDPRHLYLDTSGIYRVYPQVLNNKSTDLATFEFYPHWDALLGPKQRATTAATFTHDANTVTSHGKVFIVNEFGWDRTDWKNPVDFENVLHTLSTDSNVSGDGFWALQAHLDNFGFQPIPADSSNPVFAEHGESGEWWALYYPGVKTLVNTAEDMAARAQQLRSHAYFMSGNPVPKHAIPPRPVITSTVIVGLIAWRGSAGAVRYSVERNDAGSTEWKPICDRCATDTDDPWADPHGTLGGARYRVIAWNADGVPSEPSDPR
jgi:mannan endo-1,4-beta-mannosidase